MHIQSAGVDNLWLDRHLQIAVCGCCLKLVWLLHHNCAPRCNRASPRQCKQAPAKKHLSPPTQTMAHVDTEFIAIGANRNPTAADWSPSGLLAFGAGRCIALWNPLVSKASTARPVLIYYKLDDQCTHSHIQPPPPKTHRNT